MDDIEEKFKAWSEKKFCINGKQVVHLSSSDVGFLKDAFRDGLKQGRKERKMMDRHTSEHHEEKGD